MQFLNDIAYCFMGYVVIGWLVRLCNWYWKLRQDKIQLNYLTGPPNK